jgi:hypothetical protein
MALILTVGTAMRLWIITETHYDNVIGTPLVDDSYYYFTLGQNIAAGRGTMIDDFHVTTAFQPLWGALSGIVFSIWEGTDGIRALQSISMMVNLITFFVIYVLTLRITKNDIVALFSAGIWYLAPIPMQFSMSAMELPIAILFPLLLMFLLYGVYERGSVTTQFLVLFGVVSGISFLARVETSILAALCGMALMIAPPTGSDRTLRARIRAPLIIGGVAFVVLIPWFIFSLTVSGSIIPDSGGALRVWANAIFTRGYNVVTQWEIVQSYMEALKLNIYTLSPMMMQPWYRLQAHWIVIGVLALIFVVRRVTGWQLFFVGIAWTMILFVAFSFFVPAAWYFQRYAMPSATVMNVLIVAMSLPFLIRLTRNRRWLGLMIAGGLVLYASPGVFNHWRMVYINKDLRLAFSRGDTADGLIHAIMWLNANAQPGEIAASWGSGMITFYSDLPVVNLDGVVNRDASRAQAAGETWAYLCDFGVTYVVDWTGYFRTMSPNIFYFRDGAYNANLSVADQLVFNHDNRYVDLIGFYANNTYEYHHTTVITRVKRENCPTMGE